MPTHEKGPAVDGANPKGYNTVDRPLTRPLAVNSSARETLQDSSLQSGMDRRSLLWSSSRLFVSQLGMPLLPDWGIRPNGECRCPGKKLPWDRVRPGDPNDAECRSKPGKHPCTPLLNGRGLYPSAETDLRVVAEWIARGCNIAAIPFGHIVIDIDDGGLRSFVIWCEQAGLDPKSMLYGTLAVRSGSGGLHLYYALPERDTPPPAPMDAWLPGVDFKSTGRKHAGAKRSSKATLPGSLHPSLNRYEFWTFKDPLLVPSVLLDELRAGRAYELSSERAARILRPGEPRHNVPSVGFGSSLDPAYEAFIAAHPPIGVAR